MIKYGIIQEVDSEKMRVKVRFQDDDLVSDWIPALIPQTKYNSFYYRPVEGEHVVCHMDENCENGYVAGSIYSQRDAVPNEIPGYSAAYKNGSVTVLISDDVVIIRVGESEFQFDTDQINLDSSVKINITAPSVKIDGDLEVTGAVEADGEVKTNLNGGVSLSTHKHIGVQPGPGITGTPQPGS